MVDLTDEDIATLLKTPRTGTPPTPSDPKIESPFDRLPTDWQPAHLWAMKRWQDDAATVGREAAIRYQVELYRTVGRGSFGDLPMAVITRAKSAEEQSSWIEEQRKIAGLSSRSIFLRADGSGHDIELEQPAAVVDAIRRMIALIP